MSASSYDIGGGYRLIVDTQNDPLTVSYVLDMPMTEDEKLASGRADNNFVPPRVGLTRSGMLQCSIHTGDDWCSHIEKVLIDNADQYLIWGPPDAESNDLTDKQIEVPLVPSQDVWAHILLGHRTEAGAHKVHYAGDRPGGGASDGPPFLGFFERGEGRQVLRTMVYDWFRTEMALGNVLECRAKSHGFKAQMRYNDHKVEGGALWFAENWSVFTRSRCLTCAGPQTPADGIFDDLVPDAGTTATPSPWSKDPVPF